MDRGKILKSNVKVQIKDKKVSVFTLNHHLNREYGRNNYALLIIDQKPILKSLSHSLKVL